MKEKLNLKKLMSFFLVAIMLFNTLPSGAASLEADTQSPGGSFKELLPQEKPETDIEYKIIHEETELREEAVKHFLCEDGGYVAVMYSSPVHYNENGEWKEIDNSLVLSENVKTSSGKAAYVPKAGKTGASFPQSFANEQKLTLSNKGYTVAFGISQDNKDVSLSSSAELSDIESLPSELILKETLQESKILQKTSETKLTAQKNLSSALTFKEVFPDTNLEYILSSSGIKENIVVSEKQDNYLYRFDINLGGLTEVPQEDGSIWLCEEGKANEAVFILQKPYMYDAGGEQSFEVDMTLDKGVLTVSASEEWLNDKSRVYPVVIDPTISLNNSSTVLDTYVNSSWLAPGNFSNSINLYAGKLATGSFCRTYVRFNLSGVNIPADCAITDAQFRIKNWDINNGYPILAYDAYQINSWDTGTIKWSTQPSPITSSANYCRNKSNLPLLTPSTGVSPVSEFYSIDYTSAISRWYNGGVNNGIIITSVDETANGQTAFHSANTLSDSERPVLTINYRSILPTVQSVEGNPTAWTNQNVTLSVSAVDNSGAGLHATAYSFDNGVSWQSSNAKSFTENQTVYIKVRDAGGRISAATTVNINRIDKTSPTLTVSGNPSYWTTEDAILSIDASDSGGSGLHATAYSFDNGVTWQSDNTKTFTSNQIVKIKVRDTAGNISSMTVWILNIERTAPEILSVTGNPTTWTTSDVTLTVNAADEIAGLHTTAYSFDNGASWQAGNSKTFSSNQTVNIKVRDSLGNVSNAYAVVISKIDKAPPTFTVSGNPTSWTNQNVTLTINANDNGGSGLNATAYSFDNGTSWQSGNTKTFTENQTINIKVRDVLGQVSPTTTVKIERIDRSTPQILTVNGNAEKWTNQNVTLNVYGDDGISGLHSSAYSFDNGASWQKSNSKTFLSNQTVYIKVKDAAGNISSVYTVTINKIDKTKPVILSVSGNPSTLADYAKLTVNASDSGNSGLHEYAYSFDGGETWQAGNTKTFIKNTIVYIHVKDTAGNVSPHAEVIINNIETLNWPANLGEFEGYYRIKHVQTGKYLTMDSFWGVTLSASSSSENQRWRFRTDNKANGSYSIINGISSQLWLNAQTSSPIYCGYYLDGFKAKAINAVLSCYITRRSTTSTSVNIRCNYNSGNDYNKTWWALEIDSVDSASPNFYDHWTDNWALNEWELEPVYLKGDVDMNGKIDNFDGRYILRALEGIENLSALQYFLADLDNNGYIEKEDASIIQRMRTFTS